MNDAADPVVFKLSGLSQASPCVSVIMPVHDRIAVDLFDKATNSILEQSFTDFEFLILLDGVSSERLLKAAQALVDRDGRAKVISLPAQRGIVSALNTLVANSRGEFIARMDADDVSLPDRLNAQVSLLRMRPELCMSGTWADEIDEAGNVLFHKRLPVDQRAIVRFMSRRDPFVHPTVMFRRTFFDSVGLYRSCSCPGFEDTELWMRASTARKEMANIPVVHYRFLVTRGMFATGRRRGIRYAACEAGLRLQHCRQARLPFRYYIWPAAVFVARLLPSWALRVLYHLR